MEFYYTVFRYFPEKKIIACKAPTVETLEGFYGVIWDTDCHFIVALEDIVENGNQKFYLYWPINQNSTRATNNWLVEPMRIIRYPDHIQYDFKLIMKNSPQSSRVVTLFHYTKWPEHGEPENLIELSRLMTIVQFETEVASRLGNVVVKPIIVHGCFDIHRAIAYCIIDYCMSEYLNAGYFSVAHAADRLSEICHQWSFSVHQYCFIHNVLSHFVESFACKLQCGLLLIDYHFVRDNAAIN